MAKQKEEKNYYVAIDVMEKLGIGQSTAYRLIKEMNKELEEKGFLTVRGKISKRYFHERTYGFSENLQM